MSDALDNPRRSVWICKVTPDRTVRLEDIPAVQLGEVEQRLGVNWLELVTRPLMEARVSLAMYERCCALAGVEANPDLSVRAIVDAFDLVDDDRPDYYRGGLPDPKAAEVVTVG